MIASLVLGEGGTSMAMGGSRPCIGAGCRTYGGGKDSV